MSSRYSFRLKPEDEGIALQQTNPWHLVEGIKETTSAHGIPHINQAKGKD